MNKAFVKEEESTQGRCPRCDSPGVTVRQETLAAHLPPALLQNLTETAYFCPYAKCDVVYFDQFDRTVEKGALSIPIYPKDPDAPICGCFGLTRDEIEQDIQEGVVTRVKALLEKAKSAEAHCSVKSPRGECCVAEVQRYYMKLRSTS